MLATSDGSEPEVFAGLDSALEARLIEECRGAYGGRFAFVHALIQQTLYEELPAHRRRKLHLRVGEVLEVLRAGPAAVTAELARHFLQGGDTERAAPYAIQAGDAAAARYAHAEAAHYYGFAVDVLHELGEPAHVAEVQCRLAAELYDLNRLPDALAAYEAALATFGQVGDQAGQASVHWGQGRLHLGRYDFVAAVQHVDARCGCGRQSSRTQSWCACWQMAHERSSSAAMPRRQFNSPSAASRWRSDLGMRA